MVIAQIYFEMLPNKKGEMSVTLGTGGNKKPITIMC